MDTTDSPSASVAFGQDLPVRPPVASATSPGRVVLHIVLLVATIVTTTLMGSILAVDTPDAGGDDLVTALAGLAHALLSSPRFVVMGLVYSFTLLVILGAHELGHYIACRYYGIDATLPFFIPAPPPILMGTFGAFIKIRSPFPTRRALFDVAVAGPIAGFVFAIPASVIGLVFAQPATGNFSEGVPVFQDPLLFVLISRIFHIPEMLAWNPIQFAAWIGMFATGLNLLPVGQLDGGHAIAALFGSRGHRVVSALFFATVASLATVSFIRYGSPVWFLFVVFLAFLAFRPHPLPIQIEDDIGVGRKIVAIVVVLIFALSFMPFPITLD